MSDKIIKKLIYLSHNLPTIQSPPIKKNFGQPGGVIVFLTLMKPSKFTTQTHHSHSMAYSISTQ